VSRIRVALTMAATIGATLALAGGAHGAVVVIGNPLSTGQLWGSIAPRELEGGSNINTLFNPQGAVGNVTSPIDGAIIGWNVFDASGGPFHLRVLAPVGAGTYRGAGTSGPATPLTTGVEHFDADLPIKVGQAIGIDLANPSDKIGILVVEHAAGFEFFEPALPEGGTGVAIPISPQGAPATFQVGFNAEVQPAPTLTSVSTTEGPAAGGTGVTVSGTDLERAERVTFGGVPATFHQVSESAVEATAPAGTPSTEVPIAVTTPAGSVTATEGFFYQPVPKEPGGPKEPAGPGEPGGPGEAGGSGETPPAGGDGPSGGGATGTPSGTGNAASNPGAAAPNPASTAATAQCVVPKLAKKTLKAAAAKLRSAGCKLGKVTRRKAGKAQIAAVISQAPKAGAVRRAGTPVVVTIG
jgi:hypothetical protein